MASPIVAASTPATDPPSNPDALLEAETGALSVGPVPSAAAGTIRLSLIIPTYNEAKNIGAMVQQLTTVMDAAFGAAYEIIVVDDDSPDRTWEAAQALTTRFPTLKVMRRRHERGLSSAVVRGWQAARGELLGVIDGDLQHPPDIVPALWSEIERGADVAIASRHVEGGGVSDWSLIRRIVSRSAQVLGLLILPNTVGRVSDPMTGFFMLRRVVIQNVLLRPLGYKILIEILGRGKVRWIAEVPYVFRERVDGESKLTSQVYVDYIHHLLRLRIARLPIERFLRFGLVGLSGVVVDMGLLFVLSDPSMLGWGLTRSKLLGSEVAIVNNFLWNDIWTFGDIAKRQIGWRQRLRRFGKFQAICLAGVALNATLLNFQFNVLGMNRYVANGVAIAVVTGWNFWLNLKLSWRVAQPDAERTD
jgi:dolichol-phosphate mannosyltransferase